ncbi:SsrA-binding protein SmpB, partial [Staphylococcus hominis]
MAKKSQSVPKLTPAQKAKAEADAKHVIARNKKARHDYNIDKVYEAGLVLSGTEVKALRMGRASLTEAWIEFDRHGEAWLIGAN